MSEYLHNLTLTAGWMWLGIAYVGVWCYIAWTEETSDWKLAGVLTFWFGSFVLDAVALYTYYN